MRSMTRFLLGAALAFAWSSAALAETPEATPSIEPGDFAQVMEARLDADFEKSVSSTSDFALSPLAGPSSMDGGSPWS